MWIRRASCDDGAACAALYAPYVTDTAITFETDPPSAQEMTRRIDAANADHAWLVTGEGTDVLGYAYGGVWNARAAYRWACEVSIYLQTGLRRTGAGRSLYEALFAVLAERGYRIAVAGMTLPNDASAGLHRATGFEPVGTFRQVGWKLDAWRDVAWMQRPLAVQAVP